MSDLARLAKALEEVAGVKGYVLADAEGNVAASRYGGDGEAIASCITLMLMNRTAIEAALGCARIKTLRVASKCREDLMIFRVPGGSLGVFKTAQASGGAVAATVLKLVAGLSSAERG